MDDPYGGIVKLADVRRAAGEGSAIPHPLDALGASALAAVADGLLHLAIVLVYANVHERRQVADHHLFQEMLGDPGWTTVYL